MVVTADALVVELVAINVEVLAERAMVESVVGPDTQECVAVRVTLVLAK